MYVCAAWFELVSVYIVMLQSIKPDEVYSCRFWQLVNAFFE